MVQQTRPELASLPFDRNGLGTQLDASRLQLVAKLAEVPDDAIRDDRHRVAGVRTHHAALACKKNAKPSRILRRKPRRTLKACRSR
jgi:hypothetical protein